MQALLVDLGGTQLRCGLSDNNNGVRILHRSHILSSRDGLRAELIWDNIIARIGQFADAVQDMVPPAAPIVMSFPGPVLNGHHVLDAPTVVAAGSGLPDLQHLLAAHTGRDVHLLNDMSAAAWHASETMHGRRLMVVTVSSGIGSKVFDRSHPRGVLDDTAYAGEIGHLMVDESPAAPECDCGGRGHLGAIASGRGIERYAKQLARSDPSFQYSICVRQCGATPDDLSNEDHLVPAARLGDAWSLGVVRRCTESLARVLLATVMAVGVDRIVIIGGFALSLGQRYQAVLRDAMLARCDYRVMSASLNELVVLGHADACLLGAAVYARRLAGR